MRLFEAWRRSKSSVAQPADRSGEDERPLTIAFGVERLGLIALRTPFLAVAIAIVLGGLAIVGMQRTAVDDSLSELFRTNTPAFKQFEEETRRFPSNEYDVVVVVEGSSLLARQSIQKLRTLVTDLQLVDGASGIISMFSARQPSQSGGIPAPVFPEQLPEGADYDRLVDALKSNDLIRGKLLSDDGSLTLIVLALDPEVTRSGRLDAVVSDIRRTTSDDLQGLGLTTEFSGVPVMQLEIRKAIERDRITYNAIGFLFGCGIAILFFRRLSFVFIATGPPLLAIVLALGAVGWLGLRLNMFLNVMTPLIMVISFSDSMQLTFAARDRIIAGDDPPRAFRNAVFVVGPACVLTHATAGLSFLALCFSDSDLIRTFGEAGFLSIVIALVAVLSLVPVFGVLMAPKAAALGSLKQLDSGVNALRSFCAWVAVRMTSRPGLISLVALIVVCVLGSAFFELPPRYRLADQAPDQEKAVQGQNRIDAKLAGANPVDVMIEFPNGQGLYAPETLDVLAQVHQAVEAQAGVSNVWSLETLRRWLAQSLHKTDVATLRQYVGLLPTYLVRRFVSEDETAAVVSGRVPDKDASELLPIVNSLDAGLADLRAEHPGYTIAVTGLAVIAARNSADMIGKLSRGLTIEFGVVAIFIGLAFRSAAVTLATVVTGIFPVVAAGALLWLLGAGLQFASVIALTVSLGLGLSATIHFLNRLWRERRAEEDPAEAVKRATVLVGPALILTSVVLICGLAATAFSNLPTLRIFGWLSAFAMFAAIVADLTILRPMITFFLRQERRAGARRWGDSATPTREA
jgi:predicted RND superfamily exporter protein